MVNALRTLGSEGEAIKGVTRHLGRGRETGSLQKTKKLHSHNKK